MPELPPIREVIARHNLAASKALGQNFLLDEQLLARIAALPGSLDGQRVLEVGPGPGGLTRALLLEGAKKVIAVEKDERALPALEEIAAHYPGRLEVVAADALRHDFAGHIDGEAKIVANLPYNIATPLLTRWLNEEPWPPWYESMTLMFQKEVADRIAASPQSKAYGRLSVLAQWRARATKLFDIDRRAFTPPPNVTSSLVQIIPDAPLIEGLASADIERVTAKAFGQRRKMLRASLRGLGVEAERLIERAGMDPTARAEQLSVADFCRLAAALKREAAK